jgi:hypothetical protein
VLTSFPGAFPVSERQAFTLRVSGPRRPVERLAAPRAACSGMQATPADFAQQSILTANPPASGTPTKQPYRVVPGDRSEPVSSVFRGMNQAFPRDLQSLSVSFGKTA